ncbi:hypothetical protein [Deinococcus sp.]|uniref:hypothetical protein n=1 Tax=Deinococcus sp. TaxID=47478 RepID=UPI003CC6D1F2
MSGEFDHGGAELQEDVEFEDIETFSVTVWQDGRTEWAPADVPAAQGERVRAALHGYTGAGDPQKWAAFSRETVQTFYDAATRSLPAAAAVRLSVASAYLEDSQAILAALVMEDEISFDGERWYDLYEDELPDGIGDA